MTIVKLTALIAQSLTDMNVARKCYYDASIKHDKLQELLDSARDAGQDGRAVLLGRQVTKASETAQVAHFAYQCAQHLYQADVGRLASAKHAATLTAALA
ncbi:hypothetical protein [Massilia sp. 9096]|uniref:hypothetical protein n=1 Tax=Massilia sp. 9096 TaxID=1500894 RepID=UPI0012E0C3FF|nr:hypothetical protein [Massilia sp. 9096]